MIKIYSVYHKCMLVTISLLDAYALYLLPILLGILFGHFLSEKEKGGGLHHSREWGD